MEKRTCPRCQGFVLVKQELCLSEARTFEVEICVNCAWRGYLSYEAEPIDSKRGSTDKGFRCFPQAIAVAPDQDKKS